jgi:hypothetical protein
MQPAQARALHAAGLTSPELVGMAEESAVAEAMAAALAAPRARQQAAGGKGAAAKGCVAGAQRRRGACAGVGGCPVCQQLQAGLVHLASPPAFPPHAERLPRAVA